MVQYEDVAEVPGWGPSPGPTPSPPSEGQCLRLRRPAGTALTTASAISQCHPRPTHPRLAPPSVLCVAPFA